MFTKHSKKIECGHLLLGGMSTMDKRNRDLPPIVTMSMEHEKKLALKDYSSHHRSRRHRGFTVHFFRSFPFFPPTLWNLLTATTCFSILYLAVLTKKERKKKQKP
jgi:hypothetical protein